MHSLPTVSSNGPVTGTSADRPAQALVDRGTRIRGVCAQFAATMGLPAGTLLAQPLSGFLHQEDRVGLEAATQAIAKGEAPEAALTIRLLPASAPAARVRIELQRAAANLVRVLVRPPRRAPGSALPAGGGEWIEELVTGSVLGIAVLQAGRVAFANRRLVDLLGHTANLPEPTRWRSLVDRGSLPAVRQLRAAVESDPEALSHASLMLRRTDGTRVPVTLTARQVQHAGHPALLLTVTDLSAADHPPLRQLESERADATSQLAGSIAHSFNSLFSAILAWADIAAEAVGPAGEAAMAIDGIRETTERAAELTRQLLAYGRRQLLTPRPLDPAEVVVRMQRWLERVVSPTRTLVVTVPDAPWFVMADAGQFERSLAALILRARDVTPAGGEIRVALHHVPASALGTPTHGTLTPHDQVRVDVGDGGPVLGEAARRHLFDPFAPDSARGATSEFGLAAVLGSVLQSGGAMDVRSRGPDGNIISIWLPRCEQDDDARPGD